MGGGVPQISETSGLAAPLFTLNRFPSFLGGHSVKVKVRGELAAEEQLVHQVALTLVPSRGCATHTHTWWDGQTTFSTYHSVAGVYAGDDIIPCHFLSISSTSSLLQEETKSCLLSSSTGSDVTAPRAETLTVPQGE